MKLLLAEDERELSDALVSILEHSDYEVVAVYDGEEACREALSNYYNGIILDIMMPKMDGIELLQALRRAGLTTPILMLTAKASIDDRVLGLDTGADDYLAKPFAMKELLARLRAMLRKSEELAPTELRHGNISLRRDTYELSGEQASIRMSRSEFFVMEAFLLNPKRILSAEQIMLKIEQGDRLVHADVSKIYVSYLQKKLAALQADIFIRELAEGYMLARDEG